VARGKHFELNTQRRILNAQIVRITRRPDCHKKKHDLWIVLLSSSLKPLQRSKSLVK